MDRDEVTRELLELADQTKNLTKALRRFERQHADHFKKYDPVREAITYEVWEAVDEAGKRKYPNETIRGIEIRKRLANHEGYIRDNEKRADSYDQERDIADELNYLQDRKRILLVSLGAPLPPDLLEDI
jgi:hypothetical protein